jgi:hypothetical protein
MSLTIKTGRVEPGSKILHTRSIATTVKKGRIEMPKSTAFFKSQLGIKSTIADTKRKTGIKKQENPYTEKRIEPIDKRKMPLSVPK